MCKGDNNNVKIEIIGNEGIVGNSTFELFRRLGYKVTGSDKNDKINCADIYFICTPESIVGEVVEKLIGNKTLMQNNALVVIRSTVTPGTCKGLAKRTGYAHICSNPEFLREAVALQDEFNPCRIIIGECCKEHGQILEQIYKPLQCPIVRTDTVTSELTKLACNNYLSCIISYWNTIEEIAERLGVSGHEVGMIASLDPRIGSYGSRFHNKFDGRCLPKDTRQLIEFAEKMGCNPVLLEAVEEINEG